MVDTGSLNLGARTDTPGPSSRTLSWRLPHKKPAQIPGFFWWGEVMLALGEARNPSGSFLHGALAS